MSVFVATSRIALMPQRPSKRTRMLRASRIPPTATAHARGRTTQITVSHPRLAGLTERVHRVFDSLDQMLRHRQFGRDPEQAVRRHTAAMMFRGACDMIRSSVGGAMDFDRVRVPVATSSPLAPRYMEACNRLSQAKNKLYQLDYDIVVLVADWDLSLTEIAERLHGGGCGKHLVEEIGNRWRLALDELANIWISPVHNHAALRAWRPLSSVPTADCAGQEVTRGNVAHASGKGVRWDSK